MTDSPRDWWQDRGWPDHRTYRRTSQAALRSSRQSTKRSRAARLGATSTGEPTYCRGLLSVLALIGGEPILREGTDDQLVSIKVPECSFPPAHLSSHTSCMRP